MVHKKRTLAVHSKRKEVTPMENGNKKKEPCSFGVALSGLTSQTENNQEFRGQPRPKYRGQRLCSALSSYVDDLCSQEGLCIKG